MPEFGQGEDFNNQI